ncbi:hypothetical protein BH10CYA1_BH10CYA1_37210 [soil metagenome]
MGVEASASAQAGVDAVQRLSDHNEQLSKNVLDEVRQERIKPKQQDLSGKQEYVKLPKEFGSGILGLSSDSSEAQTERFEPKEIKEEIDQRKKDLENKYRIKFDTVDDLPDQSKSLYREPKAAELDVLERSLAKYPELAGGSWFSKPMHIAFLSNKEGEGNYADHGSIGNGERRLTIRRDDLSPVDEDLGSGKPSFGSVLMHELGHEADSIAPRDSEALGFKSIGKSPDGGDRFALETKDGRLYEFVRKDGQPEYWQKTDANGNAIAGESDSMIKDAEMQTLAKVKQPMNPSNNPAEAFANAIRMYRQGGNSREDLQQKAPEVYAYIEKYDQTQVRKLGTDFYGISEFQRNPDSTISKNSEAWNPLLM